MRSVILIIIILLLITVGAALAKVVIYFDGFVSSNNIVAFELEAFPNVTIRCVSQNVFGISCWEVIE